MDPLTAISLASNVVSFVQFASELFKSTRDICESANGCDAEVVSLECIYGHLRTLSDALKPADTDERSEPEILSEATTLTSPNVESMDVRGLAALCKADCDSLLEMARKLKSGSASTSKWKGFRLALKKAGMDNAISSLVQRLNNVQTTITLSICASMNELQIRHSDDLKFLRKRSEQLLADQKAALQHISSSLADLQAKTEQANKPPRRPFTIDEVRDVEQQFSQMSLSERDILKEQTIIKSLTFESLPFRCEAITEAHRQTFKWALDAKRHGSETGDLPTQSCALEHWLRDGEDVFWVSGKPGSGKSTLMKFISTETETLKLLSQWAHPQTAVIVSHYFWHGGTPMQRSLHGLLQTLLYEIIRKCPRIIRVICPDQWALVDLDSLSWTMSALKKSFEIFVNCRVDIDMKFCFFIDGLDEHDGDHRELCKILNGLAKSPLVKVCLSSRPWPAFDEAFGHGTKKLHVHEYTKEDIRKYAASRLFEHPRWSLVITNPMDGQWLLDQITDRAWGVFLWATLVTKLLSEGLTNRDRFSDMRRRLDSFPSELEPFFMKILTSVEPFYRSKTATTLLMALAADDPLHYLFYEFHDQECDDRAYALQMPYQPLTRAGLKDIKESTTSRLESRTRGLLELPARNTSVTFLHRTVMDFLNRDEMKRYLHTQIDWDSSFSAPLSILKAHLAFLKSIKRRGKVSRTGFSMYEFCEDSVEDAHDDIDAYVDAKSYGEETFDTVIKKALVYGARIDAESPSDLDESLTQTIDEMERALAKLPFAIADGWHHDAYFREHLVTSRVFNHLERKVIEDSAYIFNVGVDLPMCLAQPCYDIPERAISKDGKPELGKSLELFQTGLSILRRAAEASCIDHTRTNRDGETAWSRLLSLLLSPSPQRRLLLVGLLENDIVSAFIQQGADRTTKVRSQSSESCEVAWALFLSCSFDVPPRETTSGISQNIE